jgi:3'(2'), 5'-bisphosphate nucleotidase
MINQVREIAEAAGRETLRFYGTQLTVDAKADDSPLTQADLASHRLIVTRLKEAFPDIPIISEEDGERDEVALAASSRCWVVDPLDGTKEFIKQTGSFTVNIGLVENGVPVLGVVYVPVTGLTYGACAETGAWKSELGGERCPIATVAAPPKLRIVASRDHAGAEVKALLAKFPDAECLSIGSSLKFCLVAEGAADVYLRDVPTMEWDTAAAQAIVTRAGGQVLTPPDHEPLHYGKPDYRNGSLLTIGDEALLDRLATVKGDQGGA